MNALRGLLFASSMLSALPACTGTVEISTENPPILPGPVTVSTPPAEITAVWKAVPGHSITALAAATTGTEGAIAYAEVILGSDGTQTQARIKLQRLDSAGAVQGDAVELGAMKSAAVSGLTVATDGYRYLACWGDDESDSISCATVPVGPGSVSPGLSTVGVAPALVYNAGTWALAYGYPGNLAIMKITSDGLAAGAPMLFEAGDAKLFARIPLLAATKSGFLLAGGDHVSVHQLDLEFAETTAPVHLGQDAGSFAAIAASGTSVAISLSAPDGTGEEFLLDGVTVMDKQAYNGGGKLGLRAALAAEGGSLVMLSAASDLLPEGEAFGAFEVRALAVGAAPESSRVLAADHRNYEHAPCALVRLKDELFFVVTQTNPGEEIIVGRTHLP